jgi:hypothetical protein
MKFGYLFALNPSFMQFDIPLCKNCKYYKYDPSDHTYEKCKVFELKNVITNEITLHDVSVARKSFCGTNGNYYTPIEQKYPDLRRIGIFPISQQSF